jgi:hypothetical protein
MVGHMFDKATPENFDFWFKADEFFEDYKSYQYFKNVICHLPIPVADGAIVQLGTNQGVSFKLLCNHFGENNCKGYDLWNPSNHSRIMIKDCWFLENEPISFVDIDVGSLMTTPALRLHC